MTDKENGNGTVRWKTDAAEFRGFMRASVEGLQKGLDDANESHKELRKELKADNEKLKTEMKVDNKEVKKEVKLLRGNVGNLRWKVAGISGTITLIVMIIGFLLKDKIF